MSVDYEQSRTGKTRANGLIELIRWEWSANVKGAACKGGESAREAPGAGAEHGARERGHGGSRPMGEV